MCTLLFLPISSNFCLLFWSHHYQLVFRSSLEADAQRPWGLTCHFSICYSWMWTWWSHPYLFESHYYGIFSVSCPLSSMHPQTPHLCSALSPFPTIWLSWWKTEIPDPDIESQLCHFLVLMTLGGFWNLSDIFPFTYKRGIMHVSMLYVSCGAQNDGRENYMRVKVENVAWFLALN